MFSSAMKELHRKSKNRQENEYPKYDKTEKKENQRAKVIIYKI